MENAAAESEGIDPPLTIPIDRVCFLIGKLREYDAPDALANGAGDDTGDTLAGTEDQDDLLAHQDDYRNNPLTQELGNYINDLTEDEQIDLVSLLWLGRDGGSSSDWPVVREEAAASHNARTLDYLLGTTLAAEFMLEGLSILGHGCTGIRFDGQGFGAHIY